MDKYHQDVLFKIIFAVLGFLCVYNFTNLTSKVESMSDNINQLNTNVALVIKDNKDFNEDMKDIKKRIRDLEHKK